MGKERQLLTVIQLRKEAEKVSRDPTDSRSEGKLVSGMGVVIDCSAAYRYEVNRDYVQKLKVIDGTAGGEALHVYLYTNKKEELASSLKVGDVLLFNNFKIDAFNGQVQVKKAYKHEDSYFRIFSGNPDLQQYSPVDKKVGLDDEDGKILATLNNLRAFSKSHFKTNRVPLYFKSSKDKKDLSSDFDVILRVQECEGQASHYKIKLTNDKDEFHLNYPRHIENGVYKLRSVADLKWEDKVCQLTGNDYTFFLEISNWMLSYDSKEWERIVPTPDTKQKKQRKAKLECKPIGAGKKLSKVTLKDLFSKGTPPDS